MKLEEVFPEEGDVISFLESTVRDRDRKVRHLFKLRRSKPRKSRSRRRVRIHFVLGMGHRLRWATLLSHLKVSWCHFAKLVNESQPHFADLLARNHLLLHVTPPLIYWYNHLGRGGGDCPLGTHNICCTHCNVSNHACKDL